MFIAQQIPLCSSFQEAVGCLNQMLELDNKTTARSALMYDIDSSLDLPNELRLYSVNTTPGKGDFISNGRVASFAIRDAITMEYEIECTAVWDSRAYGDEYTKTLHGPQDLADFLQLLMMSSRIRRQLTQSNKPIDMSLF